MCGIYGVVAARDQVLNVSAEQATALRDSIAHRGPDDAGLWHGPGAILTHRRLSVIDTSPAGHQPMLASGPEANDNEHGPACVWPESSGAGEDASARYAIVYNGELYNEPQLRRALENRGHRFASDCDTETVFRSLIQWGVRAVGEFRGMFALAFYDVRERRLLLARDPLGVKPLYYHASPGRIVFASEPAPIVRTPGVGATPNLAMVSAYLTTIRTVIGKSTMFEGVSALRPGEVLEANLSQQSLTATTGVYWQGPAELDEEVNMPAAAEWTRSTIAHSVKSHMRADVPVCALLSGGLDSTITSALAKGLHEGLRTYAAGAVEAQGTPIGGDDLAFAKDAAEHLGTNHAEAHVDRAHFLDAWPRMVGALGVPLSTPNEVAINAVATRLRADGCVVTISGEGADELFAGYTGPTLSTAAWLARDEQQRGSPGAFQLDECAWVRLEHKAAVLRAEVHDAVQRDAPLLEAFEAEFEIAAGEAGNRGLAAHLRLQRRINLTGLLQRLDTATMLAGVEGRTPFADAVVARLAESLPVHLKFRAPQQPGGEPGTKLALRAAFEGIVPPSILNRPKASFPLPFQHWMDGGADALRAGTFARAIFSDAAIETVAADPNASWSLAWPMINLALWGEAWWGAGRAAAGTGGSAA